jgi:hypothetical protein
LHYISRSYLPLDRGGRSRPQPKSTRFINPGGMKGPVFPSDHTKPLAQARNAQTRYSSACHSNPYFGISSRTQVIGNATARVQRGIPSSSASAISVTLRRIALPNTFSKTYVLGDSTTLLLPPFIHIEMTPLHLVDEDFRWRTTVNCKYKLSMGFDGIQRPSIARTK